MTSLGGLGYREKAWGIYIEDINEAWHNQSLKYFMAKSYLTTTVYNYFWGH